MSYKILPNQLDFVKKSFYVRDKFYATQVRLLRAIIFQPMVRHKRKIQKIYFTIAVYISCNNRFAHRPAKV
ncbi:MAG: hypothetical protein KAV87_28280, partial [Desulfobacteraceae bacterium]|nr:hypothetical protein [Desulfobacteraceae bacterium]